MEPLLIVSADSHVGLPPEEYRSYLDPQYRDSMQSYLEDTRLYHSLHRGMGWPYSREELEFMDTDSAYTSGGIAGFWDPVRRLRVSEADGVVAEILHPAGPISPTPFCDPTSRKVSPELRAAGATAYNRFLADYCATAPERLLGVPHTYPWPDMDAAVSTIHWAAANRMAAIYPPRFAGADEDLPPFYDRRWDPFWAACSETGLPVHIHAGTGLAQGNTFDRMRAVMEQPEAVDPGSSRLAQVFEGIFEERRPLWQLMWSGVFDRFPSLRIVFAEIRADWIPPTLAFLDGAYKAGGAELQMSPSEYWARNCAVTPSFMRPSDLASRDTVGKTRMMFGSDYPHLEGTWPNTLDFLRVVLKEVPLEDVRGILGENAIAFYGLDRGMLQEVAAKVGPLPGAVLGDHEVDPRIIDHFDKRNGLRKNPTFDSDWLAATFSADTSAIVTSP